MELQTDDLLKRLLYINSGIDAQYHRAGVKLGMSDSIVDILYTLCILGNQCSQSDICKLSWNKKQTINSAINKLEREHLIQRQPGKGKTVEICLTEEGHKVVNEKIRPLIAAENAVFDDWTQEERETYIRLYQKYLTDIKQKIDEFIQ